jgi:hypothetical protein
MTTLDRIIFTQIVEYIIDENIIQDNFEVSLALYINQAISDSNESQVRNNIVIPFDSVIQVGILNFLCEWVDNIVEPLYNDGEDFLTSSERLLVSNNGFCVWDIIRYVYMNCREHDSVDTAMGEYLADYNYSKMFDLYMYFRARNILMDVNDNDEFVEYIDPLVEIYKEEVKNRHIIEVSKQIAIAKIKRNSIYNLGLGLKLSKLQYAKDFA